jgi:uncharacterized protein (DUF427 family)
VSENPTALIPALPADPVPFVPDYPGSPVAANHVEPVPRRLRGMLAGEIVFDTTHALYVWESPKYPQYYIPIGDVRPGVLVSEERTQATGRGRAELHALQVGDQQRAASARVYRESEVAGVAGTVRFEWAALDAWFEEDEQVFVHPRSPYSRVDALRSTRHVLIELDGLVLADSHCPVMVFETGLPTRYYVDRTDVHFEHLIPTDTVTECPYKGTTGGYWSVRAGERVYPDLAWTYTFPTRQLLPIAGLIAFYNEKVDISLDGERLPRPKTHFS